MGKYEADKELLTQIDSLELGPRNKEWRAAMKAAPWQMFADREIYTVESWKATEGEDIEIRRAKLFAHVVENVEIGILDFDYIVGRPTPAVIGAHTSIDVCGNYIKNIWDESNINLSMTSSTTLDSEGMEILRESARTFGGKAASDMMYKAWEAAMGTWPKDIERAKLKDPTLDVGIFANVTSILLWGKILERGMRGFIEEAQANIDAYNEAGGKDASRNYFWQAAIIACESVIKLAHRYAALARKQAESCSDSIRKQELIEIAETCERVPEYPARTLHEALQSMALCSNAKMLEHPMQNNSHWGRGDQYLYPYFINDVKSGRVTLEKAAEMIAELVGRWGTQIFIANEVQQETHQINFGINSLVIGGVDKAGDDVSNELSYLFLHMIGLLKLSAPTVALRWNAQTPDWLMDKAIRTNLATKGGIPLFENDDSVIDHYVADGIPIEEARDWHGLGCVYPALPTRAEHYGAEGVAGYNMAAILHITLHNGLDINGKQTGLKTGDPAAFASLDEIYDAFLKQHKHFVYGVFRLGNIALNEEGKYLRLPLLSSLGLEASMTLGQDLLIPHPDYSLFGISDRAIIDVADSLTAIKHLVFEEKKLTLKELLDALDSNFEGERGEEIRQLCLAAPKFGNDIDEVDLLAKKISQDSAKIIRAYDNSPYPSYMISREGLSWHYFGGLGVGALPNGRKAYEPLNDGSISPMRGADTHGPTAVLRSVLKTGFEDSHAHVLNQKFSTALLSGDESVMKLKAYTNTFLKNGGTHIQYNVVDTEEMLEAKAKPEEHKDLLVRIGGFSAYFTQLSPEIQDDVILRNEHTL
jgi:formate C-acetyltransferase